MTLQVSSQSSQIKMTPVVGGFSWQSYIEESPTSGDGDTLVANRLWEQINVTRDSSDYLWYMTEYVFIYNLLAFPESIFSST